MPRGAQLVHDRFPDLGALVDLGEIEAFENQSGGLQTLAVAGRAVAVQSRAVIVRGRSCRSGAGRGQHQAVDEN